MRLGLALSGGGFRATLYHLGVIRFLRGANLLRHVTHICSVSGGSVTAAHLVQNWSAYALEDEGAFEKVTAELEAFTRLDVRGRILRRVPTYIASLLLGKRRRVTRTGLLQKYYSRLFKHGRMMDLGLLREDVPYLHILATNLTNGGLCSFTRDGYSVDFRPDAPDAFPKVDGTGMSPIALAVTASSAFPGFFPPVEITHEDLEVAGGQFAPDPQGLTDGGVYDNLGIRKVRQLIDLGLGSSYLRAGELDDAAGLAKTLSEAARGKAPSPAKRVYDLVLPFIPVIARDDTQWNANDFEESLQDALNSILDHPEIYDEASWPDAVLSDEIGKSTPASSNVHKHECVRRNRLLLQETFPKHIKTIAQPFDAILVSDAGLKNAPIDTARFSGLFATAIRATDILFRRVGELEGETVDREQAARSGASATCPYVFIPIDKVVDRSEDRTAPAAAVQTRIPFIRTDFDAFSHLEIGALVGHGHRVARNAILKVKKLKEHVEQQADFPDAPWTPPLKGRRRDDASVAVRLRRSSRRNLRFFSLRDWISYVHGTLLVLGVVVVIGINLRVDLENLVAALPSGFVRVHVVPELDNPSYEGFEIILDHNEIDLRGRIERDEAIDKPISLTYWRRSLKLRRRRDLSDELSRAFRIQYEGNLSNPSSLPDLPYIIRAAEHTRVVPPYGEYPVWELELDVSSKPRGEEFGLDIELEWRNAFPNPDAEWVVLKSRNGAAQLTLKVLFSEKKPFKSYKLFRYALETGKVRTEADKELLYDSTKDKANGKKVQNVRPNSEKTELIWLIDQPEVGWAYEIQWTW